MNRGFSALFSIDILSTSLAFADAAADIVVDDVSVACAEDPACINRLHPDIPTVANADPGERIVCFGRDAFDLTLDPDEFSSAKAIPREGIGIVHALTGPVFIDGAKAGDAVAVTIEAFEPADVGWTEAGPFGFAGDQFGTDERFIVWRINNEYAVSDALPGVVTTMPGPGLLADVLARETELMEAGGAVLPPRPGRSAAGLGVRCGRNKAGRMPAHDSTARAWRQHGHPIHHNRYDSLFAVLHRRLRTRGRRLSLCAGRRRGFRHGNRDAIFGVRVKTSQADEIM